VLGVAGWCVSAIRIAPATSPSGMSCALPKTSFQLSHRTRNEIPRFVASSCETKNIESSCSAWPCFRTHRQRAPSPASFV